ncbi:MAG: RNA 2'-phosphotransferase [Anaerolineae bacterium]|nr:RNA 2'-phosphotransferase [Anaerolineae bacterium]
MTDTNRLTRLSKFLAVMLRHDPLRHGLSLDAQGYADLDQVWGQITGRFHGTYTYQDLLTVVDGDATGKKRYEISGRKIRALYGHSSVVIAYAACEPPESLYHGTTAKALPAILEQGLIRQNRQYVHLTSSRERALTTASRHRGEIVLLIIRAGAASRAGVTFYHPEAEHYLARAIPPEFIMAVSPDTPRETNS